MGDKDEEVIEPFQGLLCWKAAGQPQETQLIGQAQPVMRATTVSDLGMVSRGKADAVGDEFAGIVHRMEHGRVLLRPGDPELRSRAPQRAQTRQRHRVRIGEMS